METELTGLMGSGGGLVEADETYIGLKEGAKHGLGWGHKQKVFSLVEPGGNVRSVRVTGKMFDAIKGALSNRVSADAHLMTDEARLYNTVGKHFSSHETVNHGRGEYGRGEVHTNTIEVFLSVLKRGMKGVYQHCDEKHLHRCLAELGFRYNQRSGLDVEDGQRVIDALAGIEGKRLTYR